MELAEGPALADRIRRGAILLREALPIANRGTPACNTTGRASVPPEFLVSRAVNGFVSIGLLALLAVSQCHTRGGDCRHRRSAGSLVVHLG